MSITPEEFLNSAEEFLQKENIQEADIRNAISRAYYGVYHKVNMSVPNAPQEHNLLIKFLKEHKDKDLRALSKQLKVLRDSRQLADYFLSFSVYDTTAKTNIINSKLIFESIDKLYS